MSKVSFNNKNKDFYNSLKQGVDEYFQNQKIKSTGNYKLYLKTFILIPFALAIYLILLFFTPSTIPALLLCSILGFVIACIGFNVMHDACHGSYSTKKWVNNTLGLTMNAMGCNAFIWKIKHNIIHHTYTNVDGMDDDIAKFPIIRLCESQELLKMHKYQYIYAWFAYCLATISWVFLTDFQKYFNKKIMSTEINTFTPKEHFIFWMSKILYVFFYMAIPIYMVGWANFTVGFLVMHAVMGVTIGIVFQLAHAVENTQFVDATEGEHLLIDTEWAIHQLATTSNFATKSKTVSWFLGGLNFQVEHHLFPKVSHVHYPAINKILVENCKKFGVQYNYYSTMTEAVFSHFRYMKDLGRA